MVAEADGVPHTKALEQGQVPESHCEGARCDAFVLHPKMSQHHDSASAILVLHLGSLDGDSLVHHGGEVGEIMNGSLRFDLRPRRNFCCLRASMVISSSA